jgi:hypothetical protein
MEELSIRTAERQAGYERQAIRDYASGGRAHIARLHSRGGPRRRPRSVPRPERLCGLLLLAALVLVAFAPFAWMVGRLFALCAIVGDHRAMLAGIGAMMTLVMIGEHLLIEYSRLARLSEAFSAEAPLEKLPLAVTATARRPRRSSGP